MALVDAIRSALKVADTTLDSLQVRVSHQSFKTEDFEGTQEHKSVVSRKAIVELKNKIVKGIHGQEVLARARILFPRSVVIDSRDLFTLPDGTTGPVLAVDGGVIDPATNQGIVTEVWIG